MNNKKKIAVYVDGFNLYHGIKNLNKPYLKWLNLRSLAEKFIDPKIDHIEQIYYFSAIATHLDKETILRHRTYVEALGTLVYLCPRAAKNAGKYCHAISNASRWKYDSFYCNR